MKKMIHTVLGAVEPEQLGFTQCLEHILLTRGKSREVNPVLCIDDLEKSRRETEAYWEAGGSAIVDAQPGGCNRDGEGLSQISRQTGVHIIASTGFHKLLFYPEEHWIRSAEESTLAEVFSSELTEGMYEEPDQELTSCRQEAKAGILKTALDSGNLEGRYQTLFQAAADAQKDTGAPMMVHIEAGSSPVQLLEFLQKEKVSAEKIYFCHMDRACCEEEIFWKVLDAGVTLEFDTIGRFKYHSDQAELELIRKILDRGYEDQLLCSLDTTRARLKAYDPDGVGLTYILKEFLPAMKQAGVTEQQGRKIFVENPCRILAW